MCSFDGYSGSSWNVLMISITFFFRIKLSSLGSIMNVPRSLEMPLELVT